MFLLTMVNSRYDGMLDKLRKIEDEARYVQSLQHHSAHIRHRRKKRGMWKQKNVELPSDYKRKHRS